MWPCPAPALPSSKPAPPPAKPLVLAEMDVMVLLDLLGAPQARVHNFFPQTTPLYDGMRRAEARLRARNINTHLPMLISEAPAGNGGPNSGIQDDHIPFLQRGVPIVHLIPVPFPSVWHTAADDASALDPSVVADWARILSVFVGEYLLLADDVR